MKGIRVEDGYFHDHFPQPGEYGMQNGVWYGCCPNGAFANLSAHTVVENPDKTISVTPSILCTDHKVSWHGYLTDGVWKEC